MANYPLDRVAEQDPSTNEPYGRVADRVNKRPSPVGRLRTLVRFLPGVENRVGPVASAGRLCPRRKSAVSGPEKNRKVRSTQFRLQTRFLTLHLSCVRSDRHGTAQTDRQHPHGQDWRYIGAVAAGRKVGQTQLLRSDFTVALCGRR